MGTTFDIQDLKLHLGHRDILNQLSWSWPEKSNCIGVFGVNGAGKSSMFKCMLGQNLSYHGQMKFMETNLNHLQPKERAQLGLAGLNQQALLFWDMSVWDNLLTISEFLNINQVEQFQKIEEVLQKVGLADLKHQLAKTLSGGEQRRLEIARLLLDTPKMILLDEPFAGLDAMAIQKLLDILKELMSQGVKIMLSDHQIHPLLTCSDHILWIDAGQVIALEPKDIFTNRVEIQRLV